MSKHEKILCRAENRISSINSAGIIEYPHAKKLKKEKQIMPLSYTVHKNELKMNELS